MKNRIIYSILFLFVIFVTACSSNDIAEDKDSTQLYSNEVGVKQMETESTAEDSDGSYEEAEYESDGNDQDTSFNSEEADIQVDQIDTNRMIIHHAYLQVNVENLDKAQQNLENKVQKYGGYIVESNVYKEDDEHVSGNTTIRIPEEHFQTFLSETEEDVTETLNKQVTGQDVTEQYVDLESRLTSKQTVEERLLAFMKDAEKTEDLLKISSDLAKIQEEIEQLTGKMNYLENQTAYSTIDINMLEVMVTIPGIDGKNLNTWEKAKKQLATSMNWLLAAGSGVVVFIVGNLPIFVLLAVISSVGYAVVRRISKKK